MRVRLFGFIVLACLVWFALLGAAPAGAKGTLIVKLEWIKTSPKTVDTLSIRVDDGARSSTTRLSQDGKVRRTIILQPILNNDRNVTIKIEVKETPLHTRDPNVKEFSTEVTLGTEETQVVQAVAHKAEKVSTEEMLFLTPTIISRG